jgi:hypothetical protein
MEIELRYINLAGFFFFIIGLSLFLIILFTTFFGIELSEFDLLMCAEGSFIYMKLGCKIWIVVILLKLFKIKSISLNKISTAKGKDNSIIKNAKNLMDSLFANKEKGE